MLKKSKPENSRRHESDRPHAVEIIASYAINAELAEDPESRHDKAAELVRNVSRFTSVNGEPRYAILSRPTFYTGEVVIGDDSSDDSGMYVFPNNGTRLVAATGNRTGAYVFSVGPGRTYRVDHVVGMNSDKPQVVLDDTVEARLNPDDRLALVVPSGGFVKVYEKVDQVIESEAVTDLVNNGGLTSEQLAEFDFTAKAIAAIAN